MADDNNQAQPGQEQGAGGTWSNAAHSAADMARDGAEKARTAFQDHVVEPAKRAGEAIKAGGQRLAETGSALGGKVIDQAETNAREAFSAMRAATQAKDWSEVMRIQGEYLREQGQRSMAQAREIGELIMQFGRDAVGAVRGETGGTPGGQTFKP